MSAQALQDFLAHPATEYRDRVAIQYGQHSISYQELDARANRLANYLIRQGATKGAIVAFFFSDRVHVVAAMLAILKAGAVFVPLSPTYPDRALREMLAVAEPGWLLSERADIGRRPGLLAELPMQPKLIMVDDEPDLAHTPATPCYIERLPEDPCYIYFTSGSTGRPKGIVGCLKGLAHFIQWEIETFHVISSYRVSQLTNPGFDACLRDIFVPLCVGGTVCIPGDESVALDPRRLADWINQQGLVLLHCVPSVFRRLLSEPLCADDFRALTCVLMAGEQLFPADIASWFDCFGQRIQLVNLYGSSETTMIKFFYLIQEADRDRPLIPIGKPMRGARALILDEQRRPCPVDVPGEIYIRSPFLTLGYYKQPQQTSEVFIPNPFSNDPKDRIFKTGDMGLMLENGDFQFLGRNDGLVKVHGVRMELGAIEAALREHPAIRDAAVIALAGPDGDQRLAAYVVADHPPSASIPEPYRYVLPNALEIAQLNRHETDFFYQQIFIDQVDFQHGIALHDGDCILDVGANIGLFTICVQLMYPHAKVYAFEPIPPLFELLQINAALHVPNATVLQYGLSDTNREALFTFYPRSSCQSSYVADVDHDMHILRSIMGNQQMADGPEHEMLVEYFDQLVRERSEHASVLCQLTTLSDVIAEHGIERIHLLKIDVEKSEFDVLRGIRAEDWDKIDQITIEAHDIDGQIQRVRVLLEQHGYIVVIDQNPSIRDTEIYNLYARRSGAQRQPHATSALETRPAGTAVCTSDDLRRFLRTRLPESMIPSALVFLPALPLTPNGKLDRKALPAPENMRPPFVAPRDTVELEIARLWEGLLQIQPIGMHDRFTDLGGHSLLAVQLVARIEERLGTKLQLADLFAGGSISVEELAKLARAGTATAPWSPLVALQSRGTRRPFFCVHPAGGTVLCFAALARALGDEQPFYAFQSQGLVPGQTPYTHIETMAARYIEAMRAVQPQGPYLIGGYSMGGVVAYEMARQLARQGQAVGLLAVFDTEAPGVEQQPEPSDDDVARFVEMFGAALSLSAAQLEGLDTDGQLQLILELAQQRNLLPPQFTRAQARAYLEVYKTNMRAVEQYVPEAQQQRITLFRAAETIDAPAGQAYGWDALATAGLEIVVVPGNHQTLLDEPHVEHLAAQLRLRLAALEAV